MKFMDSNASSFSPSYNQSESPKIYLNKAGGSGLTLVIPSLKSLKAQKSNNPTPPSYTPLSYDVDTQEKRIPRPIKLKPLKEVLSKLIAQIKKKDDYAFFLHPVDVANVPGYSDVVKRPMDLGTMTEKVSRGKYRSLEDFASDLKLVTTNAKLFNPPGSIYYTEADRLEIWALEHISKAASTVIQYETDWNIDIEKDDEAAQVNVDDDEDFQPMGTPMDVDGQNHHNNMSAIAAASTGLRERSMSSQPQPGPSRRGPRGPYKKQALATGLSETLEPDGGLPGSKDGLGSFPPGSDWAKTMVALKLKGKRYKTKKERLRIEREGPPLLTDGSLDYTEMEDPFSVLSYFVPEPPSRPHLVPLYPPLYNPTPLSVQQGADPSSSQNQTPHPAPPVSTFPSATTLPLDHKPPDLPLLPTLTSIPASVLAAGAPNQQQPQQQQQPTRRKHWNIVRNTTWRKGKEREDEIFQVQYQHPYQQHLHQPLQYQNATGVSSPVVDRNYNNSYSASTIGMGSSTTMADLPAWRMPRPPQAMDFGSFAVLAGELAEETRRRGIVGVGAGGVATAGGVIGEVKENVDWEVTRDLLYSRLGCESKAKTMEVESGGASIASAVTERQAEAEAIAKMYWTPQRAAEAEEYVRDIVYGGVEGLAYVRSLAEFVDGDCYHKEDPAAEYEQEEDDKAKQDIEMSTSTSVQATSSASSSSPLTKNHFHPPHPHTPSTTGLGTTLSNWVVTNIVDPLTDGRHTLLSETANALLEQHQQHLQQLNLNRTNTNSNTLTNTTTTTTKTPALPLLSLSEDPRQGTIYSQVEASLKLYPRVVWALQELRRVGLEKIDMGALIRRPDELFLSEEEWIGKKMKEERRRKGLEKLRKEVIGSVGPGSTTEGDGDSAMVVDVPQSQTQTQTQAQAPIPAGLDPTALKERLSGRLTTYEQEGPAELSEVLEYVANAIAEFDGKIKERMRVEAMGKEEECGSDNEGETKMKVEEQPSSIPVPISTNVVVGTTSAATTTTTPSSTLTSSEDPAIRNIRLNLLALAKRAPLDTIARLPKDLVPEHIRHFVPTLGPTG